ncbi:MAG: hypothetical protein Ct9H300mP11_32480 [Chloroflexota bacterium]|nr:MAG: hypothetical protein Ct9H300mP11_32480 [Chloroflexota bacterium]
MPPPFGIDMECTGASMSANANLDVFIGYNGLLSRAQSYLGEAAPRNPLVSALYADLKGLPPLLIHVGSDEALLDDSTRLAALATDFGVDVTLKIWDNMVHVWQVFSSYYQKARIHRGNWRIYSQKVGLEHLDKSRFVDT